MTTTYSAFFSSGLFVPHNLYSKARTPPSSPGLLPSSPGIVPPSPGVTRSSSPFTIAYDSDVEDLDFAMETDSNRAPTPTSSILGGRSRSGSVASTVQGQRPRLRKRRSSLGVSASPMNAIKSPQRNAGNALLLQQRIPLFSLGSGGRSRSGSLSHLGSGVPSATELTDVPNTASSSTGLLGRMRSGSVGGTTISGLFRPRRAVRRLVSGPAPSPPPTAPLPALPTESSRHTKSNSIVCNTSIFSNPKAIFSQVTNGQTCLVQRTRSNDPPTVPPKAKGRDRAYSCTKGVTVDASIDEEMRAT